MSNSTEGYFVISTSRDGIGVERIGRRALLDLLNEDYWANMEILPDVPSDNNDPRYWDASLVIIKGEVVVPRPVTKVTEYTI